MENPVTYLVMQYNILHHKSGWGAQYLLDLPLATREANVMRVITEKNPDILVFAERHDEWAGVTVDYTSSVDLAGDLAGTYDFAEDRIEGEIVNRTPIAYDKKKFRCVESGSYRLGEEIPFDRSQNKRVVSYAVLEDKTKGESDGQRLIVFATHWSSGQPQTLVNQQSESMQTIIASVLSQKNYAALPVIVAADFNCYYANEAYQNLLSGASLVDVEATVNPAYLSPIVDHIAVKNAHPTSFLLYQPDYTADASDHKPIFCEIQIGG